VTTFEDFHLRPPIAAALERLGWAPDDSRVRDAAPTAARGNNLVAFTPPAPPYAAPGLAGLLSHLLNGGRGLLLAPTSQLDEWGALAHDLSQESGLRVLVAHGTPRAMRRLRRGDLDLLIASPETALTLASRSALRMEEVTALMLAWPEAWADEDILTPLMQDLPKESMRLVYTGSAEKIGPLAERYARKALVTGNQTQSMVPDSLVRTVSTAWSRRVAALAELVELLDPAALVIWTADTSRHGAISQALPVVEPDVRLVTGDAPSTGTVIAFDLPSSERLRQLLEAGEVVLLVPPDAEGYVARLAATRRPLRLPSLVEEVMDAAQQQRAAIVKAIDEGKPERALITLAPLFERYDPAAVAAAMFDLWTNSAPASAPPAAEGTGTSKIYVGLGKKDGATANDFVAVLTKELRFERGKIGRIELRDGYSLIEVPAQDAEKLASALNGVTVRRKRLTARVDRGPTRPPRREHGASGGRPVRPRS
jgi:ATP-dependent RNA helicase DeaD